MRELAPERVALASYSGAHHMTAELFTPRDEAELQALFARASLAGRRLVFRSGGMSFDTQSLGADWVVSMAAFQQFSLDADRGVLTVGPGLSWGDIFDRLQGTGWVPGVLVTSSRATPGGTLANNAHHHFSAQLGKEGDWVLGFRLLTPDGCVWACSRTSHPHLFYAVIGGLGWLGAVTEVTYRLRPDDVEWVETESKVLSSLPAIRDALRHCPAPWEGVYAPLVFRGDRIDAIVCRSRYLKRGEARVDRRMILYQPAKTWRLLFDILLAAVPGASRLMWALALGFYYRRFTRFSDPLRDYSFFMDGHTRMKALSAKLGLEVRAMQQAFAVPVAGFERFVLDARALWQARGFTPTMVDVLYLPQEAEPFVLSALRQGEAMVVTLTFSFIDPRQVPAVAALFEALSVRCAELGGTLQLTKNVHCPRPLFQKLFDPALATFVKTKAEVDPHGLLRNEFFERLLSS